MEVSWSRYQMHKHELQHAAEDLSSSQVQPHH